MKPFEMLPPEFTEAGKAQTIQGRTGLTALAAAAPAPMMNGKMDASWAEEVLQRPLKSFEMLPPELMNERSWWASMGRNGASSRALREFGISLRMAVPGKAGCAGKPCGCAGCSEAETQRGVREPSEFVDAGARNLALGSYGSLWQFPGSIDERTTKTRSRGVAPGIPEEFLRQQAPYPIGGMPWNPGRPVIPSLHPPGTLRPPGALTGECFGHVLGLRMSYEFWRGRISDGHAILNGIRSSMCACKFNRAGCYFARVHTEPETPGSYCYLARGAPPTSIYSRLCAAARDLSVACSRISDPEALRAFSTEACNLFSLEIALQAEALSNEIFHIYQEIRREALRLGFFASYDEARGRWIPPSCILPGGLSRCLENPAAPGCPTSGTIFGIGVGVTEGVSPAAPDDRLITDYLTRECELRR